jgi:hypothetical protein
MTIKSIRQWRTGLLWPVIAIALFIVAVGHAQTTSGSIVGTLTDQAGAVIPHTPILLTNADSGASFQAETDDSGFYQFFNIPPSRYNILVQKSGFLTLKQGPYKLEVEGSLRIDLRMRVGSENQSVTVTAESPLIQAETTSLGAVVDERQTVELPLNGRNPMNLTELVPSVVPQGQSTGNTNSTNPFAWGNYQIGGGMANQSATFIDGAPVNTPYNNLTSLVPSTDSLGEFKVDTNDLSAEYGHLAGGAIQFSTKSGTGTLHGNLWEYFRNKVLDANSWFSNNSGLPRNSLQQNQFGFNAGGPVLVPHVYDGRKKTFFFFNWEGFYLRNGETFTEWVPTQSQIAGDMSQLPKVLDPNTGQMVEPTIYDPATVCTNPAGCAGDPTKGAHYGDRLPFSGNKIPSGRINHAAANYLKMFYPSTTVQNNSTYNFATNAPIGGQNFQAVAKIDHQFSESQHVSSRFTWWKNTNLPQDPLGTGICFDRCTENFTVYDWVLDDTYTFNPTTILDLHLSYLRFEYVRTPKITNFQPSSIGQTIGGGSAPQFGVPPQVSIVGFDNGLFSSGGAGSTINDASDGERIAGNLTKIAGKHTLRFGGEYRRDTFNFLQNNVAGGSFTAGAAFTNNNSVTSSATLSTTGAGLATFLLGYYTSNASYNTVNAAASELLYPAVFATDDWRVTSKFTLHMGMRWEDNLPYTERHNNISYFDPTQVNPILSAAGLSSYLGSTELADSSTRSERSGINSFTKQVSPRFGLSYAVGPKTVISAGYGILWLPVDASLIASPSYDAINAHSTSSVWSANSGLTAANTFDNPLPNGIVPPPGRSTNSTTGFQYALLGNSIDQNSPSNPYPYVQQWNLAVQQQFGASSMVSAAYAGSKGTHLPFFGLPINVLPEKYFNAAGYTQIFGFSYNPLCAVVSPSSTLASYCVGGYTYNLFQDLPYPQYTGVASNSGSFADSTYHALQVQAQKRFAKGASLNASYTFAKLLSSSDTLTSWLEGSGGDEYGYVVDPNNLKLEKSISSNDVKHRLVISYVYDIPVGQGKALLSGINRPLDEIVGGWSLEGITIFQSGFPVPMTTAVDKNIAYYYGNYGYTQRPDVVAGCDRTKKTGGPIATRTFFNPACYTQAPAFTWGESRNDPVVRSPGIDNWDATIVKSFPLSKRDRTSLQFRTEFFNTWNRTQFGVPDSVIESGQAGTVSYQANAPREIQFAARITY